MKELPPITSVAAALVPVSAQQWVDLAIESAVVHAVDPQGQGDVTIVGGEVVFERDAQPTTYN